MRWMACLSVVALLMSCVGRIDSDPDRNPALVRGETLFRNACASCHGKAGDGAGPAASHLLTSPRDFRTGVYKFRSTPTGEFPTEIDIIRTISQGIHGTTMPPFGHMDRGDAQAIVAYLRDIYRRDLVERFRYKVDEGDITEEQFSDIIESKLKPGEPLVIPSEPPSTQLSIVRGKEVYAKMSCSSCHGETGKGDGPAELRTNQIYRGRHHYQKRKR